jgi:hypothetical protein
MKYKNAFWEAAMLVVLTCRIYKVPHWYGIRWHDICIQFHDYPFRHSSTITIIVLIIWEAEMLLLLPEAIYVMRLWDGLSLHEAQTKFHEYWYECWRNIKMQVMGGLFRLHNVTIVGYFYYLILPKLLHVSVVRPSSSRNILARITRLTTDQLFLEYS